ncbi:MAG: response regulator [Myxococcales bacterium]|nr:response regulator [Myxococcales bacterium]
MTLRILIVDDDENNRQLLQIMLAPEGYLLCTAASGEEALADVAAEPPDLILLDVLMPGMDGYQVATELKANVASQNIPVILLTAMDDHSARTRWQSAQADGFLKKPVARVELCRRVREVLGLQPESVRD